MSDPNYLLFSNTPTVTVLDNRGLGIRNIDYYRHPSSPSVTDERISVHQFDARGHRLQSIDPRLHVLMQIDPTVKPNFSYLSSLAGNVLRTESMDAGTTVALNDSAGRPARSVNATGVVRTWQYERETLPGRLLAITEQLKGEEARITERFVWASNTQAEKDWNLAGQCVRHYDTAGLNRIDSHSLIGVPLSVTRQLLPDDAEANWQGEAELVWEERLATDTFITKSTVDALGSVLSTMDAMGNRQHLAYDVAGLLKSSWLTLKGGTEQVILKSLKYSAAGQKLHEEHGSGVVTTYTYEPETQRLTGIKTQRPAGHAAGANILQDLCYEYDPAGNVVRITNATGVTHFWRNQKVVPENTYTYDSLYQLVKATGREMVSIARQDTALPAVTVPLLSDDSLFTAYTRCYGYDRGGNLTQIRHSAPATGNRYTTNITVSNRSNRAVWSTLTADPMQVDSLFDQGGHQLWLQPGQNLGWTSQGELLQVTPVNRDGQVADKETYRYDSGRQRVVKTTTQKTKSSIQTQRTLYLPGLELQTTTNGSVEKERRQFITVAQAGRAQVRVLHWEKGKPNALCNDQVRYSYDNLLGSSGLEVDGEGQLISVEEYYPYGGSAILAARSQIEVDYKTIRYSGKERDATGLYYYGYRYYQPWLGRWLSADPSGTVDGLNLFRMTRNNPINFYDSDGRAPISSHYKPGDLIYGLARPRFRYTNEVFKHHYPGFEENYSSRNKSYPALTIDAYNIQITDFIGTTNTHKMGTLDVLLPKDRKKAAQLIEIPNNIQEHVSGSRVLCPLWDNYFAIGEENKKFNLKKIYKETAKKYASSQYHMMQNLTASLLLWKRGSKLGLEIAASNQDVHIHFVLDGVNMAEVVNKSKGWGQSITASELRYTYRHQDRLEGKIHFYREGDEVAAPWIENKALWSAYKSKKLQQQGSRISRLFSRVFGRL